MKRTLVAICVLCVSSALDARAAGWQPSPGHTQVPIWPSTMAAGRAAVEAETTMAGRGPVAGRPWLQVRNVSRPTFTVYPPKGRNTGAAVVVFPGGGYQLLAIDLEGTEICDWLTSRGITCVLLKYRVPNAGPTWDQPCGCDRDTKSSRPLEDAQRTLGLVRARAAEWGIDPGKVGVMGFSAGGHLVAALSTHFERRVYPAVDIAASGNSREELLADAGTIAARQKLRRALVDLPPEQAMQSLLQQMKRAKTNAELLAGL